MPEEVSVVLVDRPPKSKSPLVLYKRGGATAGIEITSGIEVSILQVVIGIAMKIVAATFGDDLHLRSGVASEFGIKIIGDQFEFLNCFQTKSAKLRTTSGG